MIGWGALIGVAIIGVDRYLRRRGAFWRAPVLAVAIGIYLPLELAVPIMGGGVIAQLAASKRGRDLEAHRRNGMLAAAGLITGEALVGIFMAIPIVLSGNPQIFAVPFTIPSAVGLLVIGAVAAGLYRVATGGFDK